MTAPDASAQLASLKEESTWGRDDFIEDGGWATFARIEDPVSGAADLCAERLVDMEAPTKSAATPTTTEG